MTALAPPIADRLNKLVRLLSSDQDGEVIGAARSIIRTLKGAGLDIHTLADTLTLPYGKRFSEEEAAEIYRRGVQDGRRAAEGAEGNGGFREVEQSWHTIALECAAHPAKLKSDKEREFVADMTRRLVNGGKPTEKQADWLRKIYARARR
jgi:hypothetical protein